MAEVLLAHVGVENTAYHFDAAYSYRVPDLLVEKVKPGCRVMVNFGFGSRKRQGIVLDIEYAADSEKYKPIAAVLDEAPLLNSEMLKLAHWLRERTFCTYFEAAKVQLPAGINLKTKVAYVSVTADEAALEDLSEDELALYKYLDSKPGYIEKDKLFKSMGYSEDCDLPDRLCEKGLAVRNYEAVRKIGDATVKNVRLLVTGQELEQIKDTLTQKQLSVVDLLSETGGGCVREVCYFTGVTPAVVSTLEKRGIVEVFDSTVYRTPAVKMQANPSAKAEIVLTPQQQIAYENMLSRYKSGDGGTSLLYGITGSGKTSVFMRLIDEVVADGKGVIVMVPEISLTPQVLATFKSRYGKKVALFHSALSMGERNDEWKRVKNGDAQIAVGTRSAVFAPFENLGLIVVDEEQEHTYKSESSPRYDAREVARFRCKYHNAHLVLSSATPSVESYTYAVMGRYALEKLDQRYGEAHLPNVITVDLKRDRKEGNKYSVSSVLLEELEKNLDEGRQSILLINRRGYNTFVACDSCGHVLTCPSCSISLTYHAANGRMMCHYCGYSAPFAQTCPECSKKDVRYSGFGTQRIEDELKILLPEARVMRMDTDSTMSRFSHETKLNAFGAGEYDILLGTQMVAKGLDFENVTLVGVICADQQLNNDDFRSMEQTFALLTQVVGRSGRGSAPGRAIIQTLTPENNIIRLAAKQDYEAFYKNEILIRKYMKYPPYCDICCVSFICEKEEKAIACSRAFLDDIRELAGTDYADVKMIILGPMPARVAKISNKYRYKLLIKCKNTQRFRAMISSLLVSYGKNKNCADVTVTADINPTNLS